MFRELPRLERLKDRAALLRASRAFFDERGLCEIDLSPLSEDPPAVERHLSFIRAEVCSRSYYLHTSPEFRLKQLLTEGMGDCWYLGHVFRNHEWGAAHRPAFTMAEWYRLGWTLEALIDETVAFIELFLGERPRRTLTYREAFLAAVGCDPVHAKKEEWLRILGEHGMTLSEALLADSYDLEDLVLAHLVEPTFSPEEITILTQYPPERAIWAELDSDGYAQRYEIYVGGHEISNGFLELQSFEEYCKRMSAILGEQRQKGSLPPALPAHFLRSLEGGFPQAAGVSVGFDRLMMVRHAVEEIGEILPEFTPILKENAPFSLISQEMNVERVSKI